MFRVSPFSLSHIVILPECFRPCTFSTVPDPKMFRLTHGATMVNMVFGVRMVSVHPCLVATFSIVLCHCLQGWRLGRNHSSWLWPPATQGPRRKRHEGPRQTPRPTATGPNSPILHAARLAQPHPGRRQNGVFRKVGQERRRVPFSFSWKKKCVCCN